jgi:hypothetical protein
MRIRWTIDEVVAERAYLIYLNRIADNIPGDDLSDWFQARQEYDDACERGREELAAIILEEVHREILR